MFNNSVRHGRFSFGKKALLSAAMVCAMGAGSAYSVPTVNKIKVEIAYNYTCTNSDCAVKIDNIKIQLPKNLQPLQPVELAYNALSGSNGGILTFFPTAVRRPQTTANYVVYPKIAPKNQIIEYTKKDGMFGFKLQVKNKDLTCLAGNQEYVAFIKSPGTLNLQCGNV